ncbi:hypothetical protein MJO29_014046 [Puccinia striiformis f. sp. tritici]|uniref:CRAL-TRIO domain-containing protein n=1 Tax=Puccinia striiformis TaxID=27350 RepID=A0A2S4VGU4_9BASI|nr:hypothetical protein Pst134EA_026658 [Puccinia striiformis f. sp. tritici]KAH9449945.1 hypothetical protein Pst134EA_026658 [Puccinia striiformis f. sp. tritici]KAI7939310.1 hypothetical protein MJO29_014046 [Puccinia striiformis f. sp. tritici]KAI9626234.1 hypothetical protein KEM48_010485 [Puccinia striiformis f. sp. tritici PST-130]POW08719.1 hypothetical protein PSHT_09453 [Puccinia striiformis]
MTTSPTKEQEYFTYLEPSQLSDLKKFWQSIDQTIHNPGPALDTVPEKPTIKKKSTLDDRIKTIKLEDNEVDLKNELWEWIMMDDPDKMVLKYLRAKKFKSNSDSLQLLTNSLKFRSERNLSTEILLENKVLLNQFKTCKAFVFGFDKSGSPIFRVNACKHKQNDQSPRELEDFILYSMEVTRFFIVPPAETVTMLVDLSGFGMSNMDWKCTSFMISTLESYYPETLNHQIIHNAPWIFQGFWKVISTMIDPVVKSKVLFTSKNEDLMKVINKSNLFKNEGGDSDFEWKIPTNYPVETLQADSPTTSDKKKMMILSPDQETEKSKELKTREILVNHFMSLTKLWTSSSDDDDQKILKILGLRDILKDMLRAQYLKMLPLIKPRTIYHYRGILDMNKPGTIDFEAGSSTGPVNKNEGSSTTIIGIETARPSLLKTIESKISLFRSTYPTPSSTESSDQSIDEIFDQIVLLEF